MWPSSLQKDLAPMQHVQLCGCPSYFEFSHFVITFTVLMRISPMSDNTTAFELNTEFHVSCLSSNSLSVYFGFSRDSISFNSSESSLILSTTSHYSLYTDSGHSKYNPSHTRCFGKLSYFHQDHGSPSTMIYPSPGAPS
ncbi:hypothetical protein BDZ45DRAFT_223950 [Acephala macrosclerotiorum]|nr:hypothetical protein BDZ45DRAFT_223950 [Acephala macrosclerotiorum]